MYKTIKIPEAAFKNAEDIKRDMSMDRGVRGIRKVTLSEVVSYALKNLKEERENRKRFTEVAGAWADMNTEALKKEIYSSRWNSTKDISF
jgi:hypothetical protein